ncbi:SLAP domain-containing protein [Companilactobacillus jidongensis]|uniref:SLAP domain-containing protein n=1 Tax=Companilactobacillus jidongensis TaxID=2486006 RepID=UPI000F791363|nr:SLAP domain-containing protein [Companilactobacillus jidongensis]
MKKNSLLLGTAMAVLLAPGALNNTSSQNVDAASSLIGIVRRGGGTLYDANGNAIGKTLDNFSSWQLGKSNTVNGVTYYKVATNQWLRADSLEIQGATGSSTSTTTNTSNTSTKTPGYIGTVLKGGAVSVDDSGKSTGQSFDNYTAWKLSAKKTINGSTYYKVSTNQWISASKLSVRDAGGTLVNESINSTTVTKTPGYIGTINKGGTLSYDDNGNMTTNAFGNYTSWKLDAMKVVNGLTYYRIATNQWIDASAMTVNDSNGKVVNVTDTTDPSVDPGANASSDVTKTAGYIGEILSNDGMGTSSYDDNGNPTGKFYDQFSRWQLTGTKTISGTQYYRIATHEWLLANAINVYDAGGKQVTNSSTTSTNKVGKVINYAEIFNDQGVSTQYVLPKSTEWSISDSKTVNGVLYYKVADNEWIKSDTVTVTSVDNTPSLTVKYALTTSANAQIYDTSTNSFSADKNPAGTKYNILNVVFNKNQDYFFQIGPNSWIADKYVGFQDDSIYQNATYEPEFTLSATNNSTNTATTTVTSEVATVINGGTYFYNDSTNGYETSPVATGTSWKVFKIVKNSKGELFFKVGGHEWLDGAHSTLNFNLSDVTIETDNDFGITK